MKSIKHLMIAIALCICLGNAAWAEITPVDINTATAEQLAEAMTGVGQAKAEAIVAYRESHGAFTHIDELVNVRGIGLATVDRNRDRIQVSPASARDRD